jgi:hypothetical protein
MKCTYTGLFAMYTGTAIPVQCPTCGAIRTLTEARHPLSLINEYPEHEQGRDPGCERWWRGPDGIWKIVAPVEQKAGVR